MKVIFLKDVSGSGRKGQVKEVSEGHARNFLIPRGLAQVATSNKIAEIEAEQTGRENKKRRQQEEFKKLSEKLNSTAIVFERKGDASGTIFGSVTQSDIAAEVNRMFDAGIPANSVQIDHPLKKAGQHQIDLKLGENTKLKLKVEVVVI